MAQKLSLLILSFSPIYRDARVLKQVKLFRDQYQLYTCGYGEAPAGVAGHFQIPDSAVNWKYDDLSVVTRQYRRAYWGNAAVKAAGELLAGHSFDAVLANDFDAAPLALSLQPKHGVHCDLHEYAPLEKEYLRRWRWFISPFRSWICRTYVAKAQSWTTVGQKIAEKYYAEFGFLPGVVTNSSPYANLTPSTVHQPIKLVHHGVSHEDRNLVQLAEAVAASHAAATLTFFLVPSDPNVISRLEAIAARDSRISVKPPLPYDQIVTQLNDFDCGIYSYPPTSFNIEYALPNKLFDFIQARLGIIVGPSPEAAALVQKYQIGKALADFSPAVMTAAIEELTAAEVTQWKAASARNAYELSAESQLKTWDSAIAALLKS